MLLSRQMKPNLGYPYPAKTTVTELETDKGVFFPKSGMSIGPYAQAACESQWQGVHVLFMIVQRLEKAL